MVKREERKNPISVIQDVPATTTEKQKQWWLSPENRSCSLCGASGGGGSFVAGSACLWHPMACFLLSLLSFSVLAFPLHVLS